MVKKKMCFRSCEGSSGPSGCSLDLIFVEVQELDGIVRFANGSVRGIAVSVFSGLGVWDAIEFTLRVGFVYPFVVVDPTCLGATILVAQALCLTAFNLCPTQNAFLFTDSDKASACVGAASGSEPQSPGVTPPPPFSTRARATRARTHTRGTTAEQWSRLRRSAPPRSVSG